MSHSCNKELIKLSQPSPPNHCTICGNEDQNKKGSWEIGDRPKNSTTGSSRWNPKPEQLLALEELYRRGTRTPTTEQIQQIASKLRMFGSIEGKNVFYWFQNHKARERQKRRRHDGEPNVLELQRNAAVENSHAHKDLLVLRRTGNRRVEQTKNWPSSSLSHELIPVNENGTAEESERGSENGRQATWQNPMFPASLVVNPSSNSPERNGSLYDLDDEEKAREIRTLNLFPVSENREKTDGTEGRTGPVEYIRMTKPNQWFYEFIPLKN